MGTRRSYHALHARIRRAFGDKMWGGVEAEVIPAFDGVEVEEVPEDPLEGLHEDPPPSGRDLHVDDWLRDPRPSWRERSAEKLAKILLGIFAGFLVVTTVGGLYIAGCSPDPVNSVQDVVIPLLNSVGDVAIKLFSPLLAFVFGYYFSKEARTA